MRSRGQRTDKNLHPDVAHCYYYFFNGKLSIVLLYIAAIKWYVTEESRNSFFPAFLILSLSHFTSHMDERLKWCMNDGSFCVHIATCVQALSVFLINVLYIFWLDQIVNYSVLMLAYCLVNVCFLRVRVCVFVCGFVCARTFIVCVLWCVIFLYTWLTIT